MNYDLRNYAIVQTPHFIYMDNADEYWITATDATKLDGAQDKKQV